MEELTTIFDDISRTYARGFVPVLFQEMQSHPKQLAHIWPLVKCTLLEGELHRVTRELIFVIVAEAKRCNYCHVAHRAIAQSLGYCTAMFNNIGTDLRLIEPLELRHALEFAHYLVSNDAKESEVHIKRLTDDGYSQSEINEIISTTSVAVMLTTMANGMTLNDKVDPQFYEMLGEG